jgi:hypothetical protein
MDCNEEDVGKERHPMCLHCKERCVPAILILPYTHLQMQHILAAICIACLHSRAVNSSPVHPIYTLSFLPLIYILLTAFTLPCKR